MKTKTQWKLFYTKISSMLKCSTTTVSTKRAEIKAIDSLEVQ